MVEILIGILFVITNNQSHNFQRGGITLLVLLGIWALLVFEAVFDIRKMMIPDATAIPLIVLAELRRRLLGLPVSEWWSGLGAGLFIWLLTTIKIPGRQAMGEARCFVGGVYGVIFGFS